MRGVQKQYEKRIKVSNNLDTFTTYQRLSHQQHSPVLQERQRLDIEHHRIESLKCTLKSLSQQASIDLSKATSSEPSLAPHDQADHRKYNLKLDQLQRNLQQIANKDYFSPANSANHPNNQRPKSYTYNYQQLNHLTVENFDHSQKLPIYEPLKTEQHSRNSNYGQFVPSKSQSFVKKEESQANSKNNSQNKSTYEHSKSSQEALWVGRAEFKNSSKKTFSKRDIISEPMPYQNSKNLSKIFEKLEDSTVDMPRMRERADTQFRQNPTAFSRRIHKGRVTSILIADHIYTSSLDYSLRRTTEREGQFTAQVVDKFRGGIEHAGLVNGKVFAVGRDCYMRSADGTFHHKFSSCPMRIFQSDRSNQVAVGFLSGEVELFDMEKRSTISSILARKGSQIMSKWNKELFIGDEAGLVCVDWRRRDQVIPMYQCQNITKKVWMSMPFDRQFAYHSDGEMVALGEKMAKNYSYKLPARQEFRGYDWSRAGLNVLTAMEGMTTAKLTRIKGEREREEIDIEVNGQNISLVVVRERQIIYGGSTGELIIKRIKK